MIKVLRLLGMSVVAMLFADFGRGQVLSSPDQLPAATRVPDAFGTHDYTVTMISATSFVPADSSQGSHTSGSLGRFGNTNVAEHFYATLEIPAGVFIDYIGLNNLNDQALRGRLVCRSCHTRTPGWWEPFLLQVSRVHLTSIWQTDKNSAPLNVFNGGHYVNGNWWVLIIDVEIASSPNLQFFGWVEVWWRHVVSYPPSRRILQRRAHGPPPLPVRGGAQGFGNHGRLSGEPAALLPRQPSDTGPDGCVPFEGARAALAVLILASSIGCGDHFPPATSLCEPASSCAAGQSRGSRPLVSLDAFRPEVDELEARARPCGAGSTPTIRRFSVVPAIRSTAPFFVSWSLHVSPDAVVPPPGH